jgi:hypothetical protein
MVLVTHDGNILVPMEEAMMQGCAICALLAKIVTYARKYCGRYFTGSLEIMRDCAGWQSRTWIYPEHGLCANDFLMELLQGISSGDVLKVRMHA